MCGGTSPNIKQFSCYSATRAGLSRIDMGLGNEALLTLLASYNYEGRHISDCSLFWVEILCYPIPLGAQAGSESFIVILVFRARPDSRSTGYVFSALGIVWDAAKFYLRGQFNKMISAIKIETKSW